MKNGGKNKSVAFTILFSVFICVCVYRERERERNVCMYICLYLMLERLCGHWVGESRCKKACARILLKCNHT